MGKARIRMTFIIRVSNQGCHQVHAMCMLFQARHNTNYRSIGKTEEFIRRKEETGTKAQDLATLIECLAI